MTASLTRRPCVVAIDASDDLRSLYRELLGDEGYSVATLACQVATRDVLREIAPDIVLLDCFVACAPSGWELLQVLSLDEALQQVPVVICTTDARLFGDGVRASIDDGVHLLPKPFDIQTLLSTLSVALAPETPPVD